jgi:hypothetical protein
VQPLEMGVIYRHAGVLFSPLCIFGSSVWVHDVFDCLLTRSARLFTQIESYGFGTLKRSNVSLFFR